jgi:hypothetical protein
MPIPDSSGSSDTRPPSERFRSCREIADRDSLMHEFFAPGISDIPIPDLPMKPPVELSPVALDRCHASSPMDGPDLVGISGLPMSCFPRPSRTPILRMPISRSFDGFLPPVHRTDGPDYVGGSDLDFPRSLVNGNVDFPMRLNADGAGSPPRVLYQRTVQIPSGFHGDLCPGSYDLENPISRWLLPCCS